VDAELVQYYVALQGEYADGALALLAARAALLGQARWSGRADYRRWRAIRMTKVVLEAASEDLARLREATEVLALRADGGEAAAGESVVLLVLPPQTKEAVADLVGQFRLARKRRGRAPEPAEGPALVLVAAADLGMHGGKLAAQAAHAALLAEAAYGREAAWSVWMRAGAPLALRAAPSAVLSALAERYPASAVHDAGFTQVVAGSLTVVALPPGEPVSEQVLREFAPW
jgi:peptidyl-tRNA hydrolase